MTFSEIREVERRDSVLTKEQQIKRLTKPGSKYGNLNPYAVLMIGYDVELDAARKQFRKLSILTHPDKNPDQKVITISFYYRMMNYFYDEYMKYELLVIILNDL